jgi:hypothetical protein
MTGAPGVTRRLRTIAEALGRFDVPFRSEPPWHKIRERTSFEKYDQLDWTLATCMANRTSGSSGKPEHRERITYPATLWDALG